jgi:helix-turn-helix protein
VSLPRIEKKKKEKIEKEKTGSEEEEELIQLYKSGNKSFNLYSIVGTSTP